MSARRGPSVRRRIFGLLRESPGMTAREIADELEVTRTQISAVCSALASQGHIVSEQVTDAGYQRRRYSLAAGSIIPLDEDLIHELVDTYGADLVCEIARAS